MLRVTLEIIISPACVPREVVRLEALCSPNFSPAPRFLAAVPPPQQRSLGSDSKADEWELPSGRWCWWGVGPASSTHVKASQEQGSCGSSGLCKPWNSCCQAASSRFFPDQGEILGLASRLTSSVIPIAGKALGHHWAPVSGPGTQDLVGARWSLPGLVGIRICSFA